MSSGLELIIKMGQIKHFKGYININFKTKRQTITVNKPRYNNPYLVSVRYEIGVELPDPVEFKLESKHIKIPEIQAREIFIENL